MNDNISNPGFQKNEALLTAILDNVLDGIITIDELGIVRSFNKSSEQIFGYAAAEVIGNNIKMLMPDPYHSEHDGYLHNFVATGKKKIIGIGREVMGRRRDASTFPMDLAVSEMHLTGKRMFTGIVRDITGRKADERGQAQLAAIVASSSDAIMSKTLDGIVTSWNPAAEKIFGYTGNEMIGQPMTKLIPPYLLDEESQILARIRRGEHIEHFETLRRRKNGELFPVSVTVSPIKDAAGAIIGASKIARDITDHKNSEEAILKASVLTRAIVDGADHLIITTDKNGIILSFNRAAEMALGYRAEELIGKATPALFHVYDEVVKRAQALTTSGISVEPGFDVFVVNARKKNAGDTHEWTYVCKDGSRFPVSLTVTSLRDANGEISAYLGIATDITERNRALQEKQEDERRLKEAQHIAKVGSWDLDLTSGKLIWSDEIYNLFEIDKSRFGASYEAFLNAIHPDDRDAVNQAYTESLTNHSPYEITHRLLMQDGRIKWVHEHCTSDFDTEGKPLRSRGTVQDFTALRMAESVALESTLRTQAILNNVLDGIITIGESGAIESFNKSAENIFGYAATEVIGCNVKMLMPEPYHGEHDGYLHNYVSTSHKKIIGTGRQVSGLRKDGSTFPMDLAVSEMQLGDNRLFTGIVRDITERVKIERMKSEFISTVSHELRTPLTSIRGSLALIAGGVVGELPAAVKPLIEIAHKNSERLILLVNDILDMEKIEAGKMEFDMQPLQIMPLLKQALDGNRAYGEQFGVGYEFENELPDAMIKADANRLMQVLANLLSNAAKFSPQGGKVLVAAECVGQRIRISVKDNGHGIPDEFKGQIFQKFAQADSSDTKKKGGTGLGLSITRAIVEQMNGRIGFTSQPNVLTSFFVEFPFWQEAAQAPPPETAKEVRILICEDDHDIAALLRLMLEQAGLSADIAYNAAQAKELLGRQNYSAMTLDLSMPNQDGISLIRELRAANTTLPIVVVTANATEGRKELNGDAFSVVDWIGKPIDQALLIAALKQAIGQVSDARAQVLHIEDDPDIALVVNTIVGELADVDHAATLSQARRILKAKHYDLAILDISLPDGSGLDLLPELNAATPAVPVMVFSASEVSHENLSTIKSALVKSRTDNAQLLATIRRLIETK